MNIHQGHRERLRNLFLKSEEKTLPAHNLLELLLFYSIPRQDTNPIAHHLLEKFGDLNGVMNASFDQLTGVKGIDKSSATVIRLCSEICKRLMVPDADGKTKKRFKTKQELGTYITKLFVGSQEERVYALLFDIEGDLIKTHLLSKADYRSATFQGKEILSVAIQSGAAAVILAHNHLTGTTSPSSHDLSSTAGIERLLDSGDIELIDHYIVANNKYRRLRNTDYNGKESTEDMRYAASLALDEISDYL